MTPRPLTNWSIEFSADSAFQAPEARSQHLVGHTPDRTGLIITSRIVRAEGRLVTTRSGSVYELGEPSTEYLAWLTEHGLAYDPEQPVKVRGGAK